MCIQICVYLFVYTHPNQEQPPVAYSYILTRGIHHHFPLWMGKEHPNIHKYIYMHYLYVVHTIYIQRIADVLDIYTYHIYISLPPIHLLPVSKVDPTNACNIEAILGLFSWKTHGENPKLIFTNHARISCWWITDKLYRLLVTCMSKHFRKKVSWCMQL